jgi:hypothetical protein
MEDILLVLGLAVDIRVNPLICQYSQIGLILIKQHRSTLEPDPDRISRDDSRPLGVNCNQSGAWSGAALRNI